MPVQTTWVHLHGSGSDHPKDEGGFRLFLSESIADASPSESALENLRRQRRRRRKGNLRKALCFFIAYLEIGKEREREIEVKL